MLELDGDAFGPLIVFSVFWSRMTRNAALSGMLVGSITVLIWFHFNWSELYSLIPSFLLSFIAIVFFSLFDKKPNNIVSTQLKKAYNLYHNKIDE